MTITVEEIEANTLQDWVSCVLGQGFLAADWAGDLAVALEGLLSHWPILMWTKSDAGERLEPSSFSSRTWRYPKKTMKAWSAKRDSNLPFRPPQTFPKTVFEQTSAQTAERQSVLSKEVVAGGVVVVLHHEANQSQVGTMDGKVKGAVPARVKAWGMR